MHSRLGQAGGLAYFSFRVSPPQGLAYQRIALASERDQAALQLLQLISDLSKAFKGVGVGHFA